MNLEVKPPPNNSILQELQVKVYIEYISMTLQTTIWNLKPNPLQHTYEAQPKRGLRLLHPNFYYVSLYIVYYSYLVFLVYLVLIKIVYIFENCYALEFMRWKIPWIISKIGT